MKILRTFLVRSAVLTVAAVAVAAPASAHTEADAVGVAAGAPATVALKPTHGCEGSPTVAVAIRVPVAGATAGEVDGWTASATDDGAGRTVVEWTGGSLPADQAGSFPVTFDVPADQVGELLTFPSVQTCEDGAELSWIDGDPTGEYPAPRLLVLAAGSEPAATIDDVPVDAAGREQLVEVVDVDGGTATTTTAPPSATTTAAAGSPSSTTGNATPTTEGSGGSTTTTRPATDDDEDDGVGTGGMIGIALAAVVVVVGGGLFLRSRVIADQR